MDSREAALLALVDWQKHGTFLWDSLEKRKRAGSLEGRELNFAYELCCGTMRQMRLLDTLARLLSAKLPPKPIERLLVRLGLYQKVFCANIPPHAIVHSTVELAKKYTHKGFTSYLNALLRKELPPIPTVYSYTDYFINELMSHYGKETAEEILERGNQITPLSSINYGEKSYKQNRTQFELLTMQANRLSFTPKRVLDLCAAPGGKTLLVHHLFPQAKIVANDIAAQKMALLQENFANFHCPAETSCQDGTSHLWPEPFDLIIVDAPCSNSGVLYKCPEARWRIEKDEIQKLNQTQLALLTGAKNNLTREGVIWYQTCSILPQENEILVQKCALDISGSPILQLPDREGHEGGFSCSLKMPPKSSVNN